MSDIDTFLNGNREQNTSGRAPTGGSDIQSFLGMNAAPKESSWGDFIQDRGITSPPGGAVNEPGFVSTVKRTGGGMLTSLATTAEDVIGQNRVTDAMRGKGEEIIQHNPAGVTGLGDVVESPWLTVKESLGQLAPQIATSVAGAKAGGAIGSAFGPAGTAAGAAIGGLAPIFVQEYGGIRNEQKEAGKEDKSRALLSAVPATALERFGMGKFLEPIQGIAGLTVKQAAKEVGKGFLREGDTEAAQSVLEQAGAFKNPTEATNLEETALSGIMGGIGGGIMEGGRVAVASRLPDSGPLSRSANAGMDSGAVKPEPGEGARMAMDGLSPMTGTPGEQIAAADAARAKATAEAEARNAAMYAERDAVAAARQAYTPEAQGPAPGEGAQMAMAGLTPRTDAPAGQVAGQDAGQAPMPSDNQGLTDGGGGGGSLTRAAGAAGLNPAPTQDAMRMTAADATVDVQPTRAPAGEALAAAPARVDDLAAGRAEALSPADGLGIDAARLAEPAAAGSPIALANGLVEPGSANSAVLRQSAAPGVAAVEGPGLKPAPAQVEPADMQANMQTTATPMQAGPTAFSAGLADLIDIAAPNSARGYMVPKDTPGLMPTLESLLKEGIPEVGNDAKGLAGWLKTTLRSAPETRRIWNKISDQTYRRAAEQVVANQRMEAAAGMAQAPAPMMAEATAAPPAASARPAAAPASPIMRRDDLVGAIMRGTGGKGISPAMAQTLTGDKANNATRLRGLFTNGGTQDMDDLAMLLREEQGYDVRDGAHLEELIREQAAGNPVYSMERTEREAAGNAEREYRDSVNRRAVELGLKPVRGKRTLAMVESDIEREEARLSEIEAKAEREAIILASAADDAARIGMTEADIEAWLSQDLFETYTQEDFDRAEKIRADREDARSAENAFGDARGTAQENHRAGDGDSQAAEEGRGTQEGARSPVEGFDLAQQTTAQAAEDYARRQQPEEGGITREQADRERDAVPFSLAGQSQPKPIGRQSEIFTPDGRAAAMAANEPQKPEAAPERVGSSDRLDLGDRTFAQLQAAPTAVEGQANPGQAEQNKAAMTPIRSANNFAQAREAVANFIGKPITNRQTGMVASLSRNSLDKMLSKSAAQKSSSMKDHLAAVANLDALFAEAVAGWSKRRDSDPSDLKAVHRLFASMRTDHGAVLVKLTVKEMAQQGQNRLYTVESLDVNEASPVPEMVDADRADGSRLLTGPTGLVDSLVREIRLINEGAQPTPPAPAARESNAQAERAAVQATPTAGESPVVDGANRRANESAATASPEDFIPAPDGSIDYGEITPDMAKAMRRQAGKIRLQRGDDAYGERHIELRHGKDIRGVGFDSVAAFVADAVRNINAIWKPAKTSQLVVVEAEENGKVVFIELKPSDKGDFYTVNSAFPTPRAYAEKKEQKEGWVKLWDRMALQPPAPAAQAPSAEQLSGDAGESAAPPSGQSSATVAPAASKSNRPVKLDDFGERLEGARKFLPPSLREELSDDRIATQPLSKIWPADAHESIENDTVAALAFAARAEIPARPRLAHKVRAWMEKVKTYRAIVREVGGNDLADMEKQAGEKGLRSLASFFAKVRLLTQLPRGQWKRVGHVREYPDAYKAKTDAELKADGFVWEGGKLYRVDPATGKKTGDFINQFVGDDYRNAVYRKEPFSTVAIDGKGHGFKTGEIGPDEVAKVRALLAGESPRTKSGLTASDFEIRGWKAKNEWRIVRKADGERRPLKEFKGADALKEARAFLKDAGNIPALTKAWEDVKARDNVGKADTRRGGNRERIGENRRGGKDVTERMFSDAFGFRGVQFGNWVGQGKGAKERQGLLNESFDALHDLAEVLDIPSRAISLNGELGLALGARGKGRAAAHFERDNLVINLTKTKGAGSLAHEWFHALDNYFNRLRGDAGGQREENYITYKPEPAWVNKAHPGWPSRASADLRLRLQQSGQWNDGKSLDENAEAAGWQRNPNHPQGVRPEVERAFAELVEALNASPMATRSGLLNEYWNRIIERGARSFENYVISKLAQQGKVNDFLANVRSVREWEAIGKNQDRYPYLMPEEEAPVVAAFDKLFDTVETRQGDDGNVVLYNVADDSPEARQFAETERAYGGRAAYDKAKAAGNTKLNYRQWVQVRTPAFKAWFGDWEALRAQERLDAMNPVKVRVPDEWRGLSHVELRNRMAKELDRMVRERTEIKHPELGTIRVGRVGAKKSEGSARDPAKSLVAADIEALIPSSIYARSETARNGEGSGIDGYSTLLARVSVDGVPLVAAFTVRHQSDGRWYYNAVTLHDGREKAQDSYGRPDPSETGSSVAPIAGLDSFIRRQLHRVNPDSVSKVIDPDTGEPLVVYHGTHASFDEFRPNDALGGGMFFSPDPREAGAFASAMGANIMPVFLNARSPRRGVARSYSEVKAARAARSRGQDAVMVRDAATGPVNWVVFDPVQIKSATGNTGAFDGENPDIRRNRADKAANLSAADKAIYGMAAEGKGAREVLEFIARGSRNPFNRQLAKLLLKTGIDPTITVGDGKGWKLNAGEGNRYAAGYNPKTDTIALFKPGASERNMLHEMVHAATVKALAKKGMAMVQMRALFRHVTASGKLRGMYGMANLDEFVAEAFTNPKFQEALKGVSAPTGGSPMAGAWHWFVRIVRGILGLSSNQDNALSRALDLGLGVMQADMAIRQDGKRPANAEAAKAAADRAKAGILQGEPVADLDTNIAPMGAPAIRAWASRLFKEQGGKANNPTLGDVLLDDRAVRTSLAHGRPNEYRVAAFAAIRDVLEKGAVVLEATHGRIDSYYVSAPVRLSGVDHIVTALVHRDHNTQRMYLHSVATKENLLSRRVSSVDAEASERSGSIGSEGNSIVGKNPSNGKATSNDVARELQRLLTLDRGDNADDIRYNVADEATEAAFSGYTEAQRAAASKVFGFRPNPSLRERANGWMDNLGMKLRQGLVDQFAAIEDIDPRAYLLARLSRGSEGTMEAMMLYGPPFLNNGAADVKIDAEGGVAKMLAGLDGEHDRFLQWVAAQRAERLKADGRENLLTDDDISALKTLNLGKMADGKARPEVYRAALERLNQFNNAVLKLAQESGLIDQAGLELFRDQPYVPFYRLMEGGDLHAPNSGSGLVNQKAFKKLKGGTQQINADLLHNMMMNWAHLFEASAKNRAALATMDAAAEVSAARLAMAGEKNTVRVMRDGKAEHWSIDDPYLLEAVSALHYAPPAFMKPLARLKHLMTWGVTVNPAFKIRNLIRDSLQAMALADMNPNVAANLSRGWKLTAEDSQTYASMLAGGGLMKFGSQENSERMRSQIERLGGEVLDKNGWQKLTGQMQALYETYQALGDRTENMNRAALYQRLVDKGHSHAEASFMARDLMDFSMGGAWPVVRFLTQTVPFLNARMQGLYKLGKSAKEDPKRVVIVTGAVALASLALLGMYGDDDDWKRREDHDRDNYWWFKIGRQAYRIPKPFEIGAIATVAERTAEWMFDKEMTGGRYLDRMSFLLSQTFALNPIPQAVRPFVDVYANKDDFTGRAIESQAEQNLRPQDRYNERTSEVARWLGRLGLPNPLQLAKGNYSAMSPKQIDYLLRGYLAWVGTVATTMTDYPLRAMAGRGDRPDKQLRDVFLVGNFVQSLPAGGSRYVTALYEQSRAAQQTMASYRDAMRLGNTDKARSILESEGDTLRRAQAMNRVTDLLSKLNTQAKRIEADANLDGATKRLRLNEIEARRHEAARMALSG